MRDSVETKEEEIRCVGASVRNAAVKRISGDAYSSGTSSEGKVQQRKKLNLECLYLTNATMSIVDEEIELILGHLDLNELRITLKEKSV